MPTLDTVTRAPLGFWTGFTYAFRGMKLVYFQHPGLIRYWGFPILITILVMCLGSWAVWSHGGALLDQWWEAPADEGWLAGIARFFHGLLAWILKLVLWAVSMVLFVFLSKIIAAPFNSSLSAAVERILRGNAVGEEGLGVILRDIGRTVALELVKLVIYLAVMVPLFILQCGVPGFGSVIVSVVGFLFTAWFWGIDYTDWPAERRGWNVGARLANARRRFSTWLGFGTGVWMLLFIPLLNLFFMPAAVAGGTMLFLDQEGTDGDPAA